MKINKILLTSAIAVIATSAFEANAGFYAALNAGVCHSKYSAESEKVKKTRALAGLGLGYGCCFDQLYLAFEVEGETIFGSLKAEEGIKVKNQWQAGFMPVVGWQLTPEWMPYLTAGAVLTQHKAQTSDGDSDKYVKMHPVVGFGVRYDFAPNLFAKMQFNYQFKSKVKGPLKYQSCALKLALGYKF